MKRIRLLRKDETTSSTTSNNGWMAQRMAMNRGPRSGTGAVSSTAAAGANDRKQWCGAVRKQGNVVWGRKVEVGCSGSYLAGMAVPSCSI